jgi:hypothetical protein
MKKKFNITGTCYPHRHYMMDNGAKLSEVMAMVEAGEYFTINRPRQYGKTTTLFQLTDRLTEDARYLPIRLDFQGIDEMWHASDQAFAQMFVRHVSEAIEFSHPKLYAFLQDQKGEVGEMDSLSRVITRLAHQTPQPLILLIDEVDASSNYEPFLRFLGMLRRKYLDRESPQHKTFHSVILAGVHDIKSLKLKVRSLGEAQYNSPWNIATDFEVEMSFRPHEIAPMLAQYSEAEGVAIDIPLFSEKLYYYTSGYPFLVSKLCKTIAEKLMPQKTEPRWTLDDLEASVQLLLRENNTNFESLIKSLERHEELYDLVFQVIINGLVIPFNPDEPVTSLGRLYGIFKDNGQVRIHNRIYEQRLYNYMAAKTFRQQLTRKQDYLSFSYAQPDGHLNLEGVVLRFQEFLREQYSTKDQPFLERAWRLVFLAFLKPIINGHGHDFKEVEVSEERRLDVVVTYYQHQYIIELKRWYGEQAHQRGLDQLADYLDRKQVERGYLVIFESRQEKTWRQEQISHRGKDIFAVWV